MKCCWVNGKNLGDNIPPLSHFFILLMKMPVLMFSISTPRSPPHKLPSRTASNPLIPRTKINPLPIVLSGAPPDSQSRSSAVLFPFPPGTLHHLPILHDAGVRTMMMYAYHTCPSRQYHSKAHFSVAGAAC